MCFVKKGCKSKVFESESDLQFWVTSHFVSSAGFGYFVVMSCIEVWVGHNDWGTTPMNSWWDVLPRNNNNNNNKVVDINKINMYTCMRLLCVWGGSDGGGMNVAMCLLTAHADERCNHSSRYYPLSTQRRWTYHTDKNQSYYSIIYIRTNYQKLCKYSSTVTITCSFHYLIWGPNLVIKSRQSLLLHTF
jgi:hypothetical protein